MLTQGMITVGLSRVVWGAEGDAAEPEWRLGAVSAAPGWKLGGCRPWSTCESMLRGCVGGESKQVEKGESVLGKVRARSECS